MNLSFGATTAGSAVKGDLMSLLLLKVELELRETLFVLVDVECFLIEVNELIQVAVVLGRMGGGAVAVVCHLNN